LGDGTPAGVELSSTTTNPVRVNVPASVTGGTITVIATSVEVTTVSGEHTITVSGVPFPLFRRVLNDGASAVTPSGNATFSEDTGRLSVTGAGAFDTGNFKGHLVWVGIPVRPEAFEVQLDITVDGSSHGSTGPTMGLFIAHGDPATTDRRTPTGNVGTGTNAWASDPLDFNGWSLNIRNNLNMGRADFGFVNRVVDASGSVSGNTSLGGLQHRTGFDNAAFSAIAAFPSAAETETITLRLRHGAADTINDQVRSRPRISVGFNGQPLSADVVLGNHRFIVNANDDLYVGIFVNSGVAASPSTAVISGLRIRFEAGGDLVDIPLNTPITLVQ
jgi:hypothetical protein